VVREANPIVRVCVSSRNECGRVACEEFPIEGRGGLLAVA
jgi:hypothetical protein